MANNRVFKWLLVHLTAATLGAAYVWAFSPSESFTPLVGAAFAMSGSIIAFWQLVDDL